MARTPANQDVPPEVLPLREEGNSQQGVKVEALHQQPEETCHDAVLEENHHGLAAHLERGEGGGGLKTENCLLEQTVTFYRILFRSLKHPSMS